jgi:hypothetical protein
MESKVTAVEWLVNRWKKLQSKQEKMTWNQIIQITELAKELEKQQAFEFWKGGIACTKGGGKSFEQYYNETFTEPKKD